jgi:hypothetical protein
MKKIRILQKINNFIHGRLNVGLLYRGNFKRWLLNTLYYKEIGYAMYLLNGGYGDKYKAIRKLTDGHLTLFSGIVFLENGITSNDKYDAYVKLEKEKSELVKGILAEIAMEEKRKEEN